MYKTASEYYKEKYGCKVYRLSIDAGFTCPNRDGTVETRGCIFCSQRGSGEFAERGVDIQAQLQAAKRRVESKNKGGKYIAYLQAFSNTYAPLERLKEVYYEAIEPEYVVGLAIGTRPDCLPQETVELLREINLVKPVTVELGLQTVNPNSVRYIRRGYGNEVYFDAVERLKVAGIEVITHIILGLPYETGEDALNTTGVAISAGTDGVKFHLLHVLKGTDLEAEYRNGKFDVLSLKEYACILKKCIALLPEDVVVHRITGDGAKRDLVAPQWSADKKRVLNYLKDYLKD